MLSESEFGGKYDQLRTVSSEHAIPSVATRPIAQILVAPADQSIVALFVVARLVSRAGFKQQSH